MSDDLSTWVPTDAQLAEAMRRFEANPETPEQSKARFIAAVVEDCTTPDPLQTVCMHSDPNCRCHILPGRRMPHRAHARRLIGRGKTY